METNNELENETTLAIKKLRKTSIVLGMLWLSMTVIYFIFNPFPLFYTKIVLILLLLTGSKIIELIIDKLKVPDGGQVAVFLWIVIELINLVCCMVGFSFVTSTMLSTFGTIVFYVSLYYKPVNLYLYKYHHISKTITDRIWNDSGDFILFSKKEKIK